MMNFKAMAAGLAFSVLLPAAAFAANGYATANVNLRAGPSTQYPAVTVIPVGTGVDIFGCMQSANWCDVGFAGIRGWVSGSYLQALYDQRRVEVGPRYYGQLGIPSVTFSVGNYWERHYRQRDFYRDRDRWDNWDRRGPPPRHGDYRPPRGDHRPPRGDDHRPPRGDDFRPPRGDDFRPPRGDDFRPPRGDDFRPPRGDDYRPPRGDDHRPSRGDDFRPPRFDDNDQRPDRGHGDADNRRRPHREEGRQRDDNRPGRDRDGNRDRNDRHRDAQHNDGDRHDDGQRNKNERRRPPAEACPDNDDRCKP